jgi:hypothetical protein
MHVRNAEKVLDEMIRVTKGGGMVLTCEANRNAHSAMFHIDETNEMDQTPLGFFQRMNIGYRDLEKIDYNIGVKLPIMMKKRGLINVGARMSDLIPLYFPPMDSDYKRQLFKGMCDEGYGETNFSDEEYNRRLKRLMELGLGEDEIRVELDRESSRDFAEDGKNWHIVYPSVLTWSFGTVV